MQPLPRSPIKPWAPLQSRNRRQSFNCATAGGKDQSGNQGLGLEYLEGELAKDLTFPSLVDCGFRQDKREV